ncbi:MAG: thiolase family protein [Oscillospiraceae bacterium]|nr:thiolase family protein [Oscillospiraceae bacterium]
MSHRDAVIVAYGRSAIAKASKKGFLRDNSPVEYGSEVLRGVLARIPQCKPESIGDIVIGCAKPEGVQGMNIGRIIAQRAQLPDSVPGKTVNRFCASGLEAIAIGANEIMSGQAEVLAAGGVESMTAIPMGGGAEYRNLWLESNTHVYMSMGLTAENVAEIYGVTREDMERMAVESNRKAGRAQDDGLFEKEIIPVTGTNEAGEPFSFRLDQGVRRTTTMETLAGLKPSFKEDGRVTAATASQVSDGAAFVVMMSADKAAELNVRPIARFVAYAVAGVPADQMGLGPIRAIPQVMARSGLTIADMDVIELNEAFAAQAIPCIQALGLDPEKVNPRGGALALGHPLGATGGILTCKALSYLQDTGGKYALIAMCIGGGMGAAGIIQAI